MGTKHKVYAVLCFLFTLEVVVRHFSDTLVLEKLYRGRALAGSVVWNLVLTSLFLYFCFLAN